MRWQIAAREGFALWCWRLTFAAPMLPAAEALPIVYLPGANGRASVWQPIAERLAGRRKPILCNYPGFGAAPPAPGIESLEDLAELVLAQFPERFDLVAWSMGGVLALRIAIEHPQRIRRLVLASTSGGIDVRSLGGIDWRESYRVSRPELPQWFAADASDFSARLSSVKAPTLLVFGDQDLIAPVSVGTFLRERLPGAKLEVIAGATHDLDQEHPDLIASLIEAHLRGE